MYDQSEAARRRIISSAASTGPLGRKYIELSNILLCGPDSPQRTSALKALADSCDHAAAMAEKMRQSMENSPRNGKPPGQTNG